ncbi:hypothetical protein GCM10009630_06870 [Kribbella jejuensis]|uniref:Uncharacterized protein n=1 Tax=Kribbella jejuensis TaxID=236068 RepID=A0A542EQV1_9ACTN|nr:hypothetical protein [Kribbella jejuensis]TQJ17748.1 hypothetical protein FB475_1874 [Kribbella jejuensis]
MRQLRTVVALVGATLCTLAGLALPASATGTAEPAAPKKLFSIKDDRIKRPTGLVRSSKHQGTYWAVSSSGDTGRFFALDATGKVEAVFRFGAKVEDVEALGMDRNGTLYIADIGDSKETRQQIEIYTIPEPDSLQDANVKYHQYDFKYPDGAHDAETLLIDPETSQLYVVTKSSKGAGAIYSAPPAPTRQGTNDLTKLAPAPNGVITDGTFLPDGQQAVLRTTTDLATVAWGDNPNAIARSATLPGEGDSIALGGTDGTVVFGSDGTSPGIYELAVPVKAATGTKTTTATGTPKPASTSDSTNSDSGKSHNLRWIIIGAALFALVITVFTFPPGRRERADRQAENDRLTGRAPRTPHRRQHS